MANKKTFKKALRDNICGLLAVFMIFSSFAPAYITARAEDEATTTGETAATAAAGEENSKTEKSNKSAFESSKDELLRANEYIFYQQKYKKYAAPQKTYTFGANNVTSTSDIQMTKLANYMGESDVLSVVTRGGSIFMDVEIESTGVYNFALKYMPDTNQANVIQIGVKIDGKLPFDNAKTIELYRTWKDDTSGETKDKRGNDISPSQIQLEKWVTAPFKDVDGYFNEPYKFFLTRGKHTIEINDIRQNIYFKELVIYNDKPLESYDKISADYKAKSYKSVNFGKNPLVYQAEKSFEKSSSILRPVADRSSVVTQPQNAYKFVLNTIGEYNWKEPRQWISWKIEAPEDGLYKLDLRFKQSFVRGFYATRRIYIDDKVPFAELDQYKFKYNNKWQVETLGNDKGEFEFYLTKGEHTIKMESVLGDYAQTAQVVSDALYKMNVLYRWIVVITGPTPDVYRDYNLEKEIPQLVKGLKEVSMQLEDEYKRIQEMTGSEGNEAVILKEISFQCAKYAANTGLLRNQLDSFKGNISGLSTWAKSLKEQPVQIDYFVLRGANDKKTKNNENFFNSFWYNIERFIASFVVDYTTIGDGVDKKSSLKVWTSGGREQAELLKRIITDSFTPETSIPVNLELVSVPLNNAILAGTAPDVVMSVAANDPVNLAVRKATYDLSKFDDFNKIISERFIPGATIPYEFNGGTYGLPLTLDFGMTFYRKDILEQLGLSVPQTWNEFIACIPVIQRNNMDVGFGVDFFGSYILQNGGQLYAPDKTSTLFTEELAIEAFKKRTEFYTLYKLPLAFDFFNRFRTGEMPLAITGLAAYNQVTFAAPEIRNLWGIAPIPGTKKSDGTIDRTQPAGAGAIVILQKAKNPKDAWEYLKWWTSFETQDRYAKEIEALQGPAARYYSATLKAFNVLPWSKTELQSLTAQINYLKPQPELIGGYYVGRGLEFAFREVVYNGRNYRDALTFHNKYINREITFKRNEFGLPVAKDNN